MGLPLKINQDAIDLVTVHACERYAERVMGIPDITEGCLSFEQRYRISELIARILFEKYPKALSYGEGRFTIPEEDVVMVMVESVIVTITGIESNVQEVDQRGGMHRRKNKRYKSFVGPEISRRKDKKSVKKKYSNYEEDEL